VLSVSVAGAVAGAVAVAIAVAVAVAVAVSVSVYVFVCARAWWFTWMHHHTIMSQQIGTYALYELC